MSTCPMSVGAILMLSFLSFALGGRVARAQEPRPEDVALARSLFHEAVELSEQGQHEQAIERYRRVMSLRASPVVRWNLAHELVQVGALVEAEELLRQVGLDEEAQESVRASAEELRAEISRRIGRLTLRLEGDPEGVVVRLDDRPLPPAAIGVATPVDPGSHVLRVLRGELEVARGTVEVPEGEEAELSLEVPPPPPGPEQAARSVAGGSPAPGGALDAEGGSDLTESPWFWATLAGAAVVLVAVPLAVGVAASDGGGQGLEGDLMPGRLEFGP